MRATLIGVAVVLVALASGCDPALHLKPLNLKKVDCCRWIWQSDGFDIQMRSLGGLIGSTSEAAEFTVINRSPSVIVLENVELRTKGRTYEASFSGHRELDRRSAEPGATKRINVFWHFDGPLYEVYGSEAEVELQLAIGGRAETIVLTYRKT